MGSDKLMELEKKLKELESFLKDSSKIFHTVLLFDSKGAWIDFKKQLEKLDKKLTQREVKWMRGELPHFTNFNKSKRIKELEAKLKKVHDWVNVEIDRGGFDIELSDLFRIYDITKN